MTTEIMTDPGAGILLVPGFHGKGYPGNGNAAGTECCCDECDFYLVCYPEWDTCASGEKPSVLVNPKDG